MNIQSLHETPIVDHEQFEMLSVALEDEAAQVLSELLQMFAEDALALVTEIQVRFSNGDRIGAAKVAHALAGSSGNIGAQQFFKTCKAFEEQVQALTLAECNELTELLKNSYQCTYRELSNEIAALKQTSAQ